MCICNIESGFSLVYILHTTAQEYEEGGRLLSCTLSNQCLLKIPTACSMLSLVSDQFNPCFGFTVLGNDTLVPYDDNINHRMTIVYSIPCKCFVSFSMLMLLICEIPQMLQKCELFPCCIQTELETPGYMSRMCLFDGLITQCCFERTERLASPMENKN